MTRVRYDALFAKLVNDGDAATFDDVVFAFRHIGVDSDLLMLAVASGYDLNADRGPHPYLKHFEAHSLLFYAITCEIKKSDAWCNVMRSAGYRVQLRDLVEFVEFMTDQILCYYHHDDPFGSELALVVDAWHERCRADEQLASSTEQALLKQCVEQLCNAPVSRLDKSNFYNCGMRATLIVMGDPELSVSTKVVSAIDDHRYRLARALWPKFVHLCVGLYDLRLEPLLLVAIFDAMFACAAHVLSYGEKYEYADVLKHSCAKPKRWTECEAHFRRKYFVVDQKRSTETNLF